MGAANFAGPEPIRPSPTRASATLGAARTLDSFHLAKRRASALVRTRRDGRTPRVYYALDPDGWAAATAVIAWVLGLDA